MTLSASEYIFNIDEEQQVEEQEEEYEEEEEEYEEEREEQPSISKERFIYNKFLFRTSFRLLKKAQDLQENITYLLDCRKVIVLKMQGEKDHNMIVELGKRQMELDQTIFSIARNIEDLTKDIRYVQNLLNSETMERSVVLKSGIISGRCEYIPYSLEITAAH